MFDDDWLIAVHWAAFWMSALTATHSRFLSTATPRRLVPPLSLSRTLKKHVSFSLMSVLHLRLYKTRCMAKSSVNLPGAQTC